MEDQESPIDHNEKVKQAKDTLKSHSGTRVLDEFVTHTEEHDKAVADGNSTLQKETKDGTFDQWVSHSMADNADHEKFGSLQSGLLSQCGLNNDHCPKNIESDADVLNKHNQDDGWKKRSKGKSKETGLRKTTTANRSPTQTTMRRMSCR